MFNHGWLRKAFLLAGIAFLLNPGYGVARQTVVIGSLGLGYDFWEREYDNENARNLVLNPDEGDKRDWGVWPEIELQSLGIHDSVSLRYAPVLIYADLEDTTDVDHYLTLAAERSLVKNWKVLLDDDFVLSDDPRRYGSTFFSSGATVDQGEIPGQGVAPTTGAGQPTDEITQDLGRIRYWTNNFILQTTYTYADDSDVGLGYGYRVLRNESDDAAEAGYDEYDRHEFFGLWSYRMNASWRSELELSYIQGLYEDITAAALPGVILPPATPDVSQDLEEYRADIGLEYDRNVNDSFPLLYRFRGAEYEGVREDIWVHELAPGWDHAFDAHTHLIVRAGPSYVDAEELDGEWGYNAYANFTRAFQHGDLGLLLDKRYDTRNFTGSDDTGLTDVTDVRLDLTYRFSPTLSSTAFALYRYEDILNPKGVYYLSALGESGGVGEQNVGDVSYSRDSVSAGASVDYGFWKWFVASVRYVYYQQDGNLDSDSYNDHRVMFLVSASKELWR